MKVVYHEDYNEIYLSDPASAAGRIQAVEIALRGKESFSHSLPASREDILRVHTAENLKSVEREGVYDIAALAAVGRLKRTNRFDRALFCLIRPPGHHASAGSAWGFCYFNRFGPRAGEIQK